MKGILCLMAAAFVTLCPQATLAYENDTHSAMTSAAFDRSQLATGAPLSDWGLSIADTLPSWSQAGAKTPRQLIVIGVVGEDDGTRPQNHFFDPAHGGAPLTTCVGAFAFGPTYSSPDWAIDGSGQSGDSNFSYSAARIAMLAGLTSQSKEDRDQNLGRLFESVGHLVHHLQDMAQPQHVRNDAHQDFNKVPVVQYLPWPVNSKSRYEQYAEDNQPLIQGFLNTYQVVHLPASRDYWDSTGSTIVGMAKFTNYNFVSQGSNFVMQDGQFLPNPKYVNPLPYPDEPVNLHYIYELFPSCLSSTDDPKCSLDGEIDFVQTRVFDDLANPNGDVEVNPAAAMFSIFNQDLQPAQVTVTQTDSCGATPTFGGKLFTVNALTFPTALQFLVPRAVGYSAGMMDYFFRGKIDLVSDVDQPGALKIVNQGDEPMTGTFTLYYDDADNVRYPVPGAAWPVENLAPGGAYTPTLFGEPIDPAPKTPGEYLMVFTGTMGSETPMHGGPGAVVAKVVHPAMPEFYWNSNQYCFEIYPEPCSLPAFGFASLSFMLPQAVPNNPAAPDFDTFLKNNVGAIHVRIRGNDIPQQANPPDGVTQTGTCGTLPIPLIPATAGYSAGYTADPPQTSWYAILSPNNSVIWVNPKQNLHPLSWPDNALNFLNVEAESTYLNTWADCGNLLNLIWPDPGTNTPIEFMVGTRTLFRFCARLEVTYFDNIFGPPAPMIRAVLSHIQGAGIKAGAFDIRGEENPLACGY